VTDADQQTESTENSCWQKAVTESTNQLRTCRETDSQSTSIINDQFQSIFGSADMERATENACQQQAAKESPNQQLTRWETNLQSKSIINDQLQSIFGSADVELAACINAGYLLTIRPTSDVDIGVISASMIVSQQQPSTGETKSEFKKC
jgi:hypothetical protein